MIPQQNLSLLANRLHKRGGLRIPEATLERDYCLAWFLVGLGQTILGERLAFKGGTAIKRCYVGDYRFSEDLDFTLTENIPFETIRKELDLVFEEVRKRSQIVFRFEREDPQSHQNAYTSYLSYDGPLPGHSKNKVKVDITIKERLVFPIEPRKVLRGYDEYEDVPENAVVRAYSLEEIAVEKIVALGDLARNEPRDLYDAWFLSDYLGFDRLKPQVLEKLDFRSRTLEENAAGFKKKEARLKKNWSQRLSTQVAELPEFDGVYRAVQRALRKSELSG